MHPELTIRSVETEADWQAARRIRTRVFIEEQACPPEEEWDAYDTPEARGATAHHILAVVDGEPIGTARWHVATGRGHPTAKLERFAVLPVHRGHGYGRALVARAMADARAAGYTRFVLHAQVYLQPFYESFGFIAEGGVFDEAGIPHVKMHLTDS